MRDRDRQARPGQLELEALDLGDEAAHREQSRGRGTPGRQRERVGHHGSLREAADHRALPGHPALPGEGLGQPASASWLSMNVWRCGNPTRSTMYQSVSAGRKGQRPARHRAREARLRVERVQHRVQVP